MKPFILSSILAPTDLSDSSIPALRHARFFADRFSAKLTVMYADTPLYPIDYAGMPAVYPTSVLEQEGTLRDLVQKHAGPLMTGRPYDVDVTVGPPAPSILLSARERNADMIVIGTHLRHGWRRAILGSVSEEVLHGSDCPVLTVAAHDGATPYGITRIVCPVNFTDVARDALHVTAGIAKEFGAIVTVVHVIEPDETPAAAWDEAAVRSWIPPELQDLCTFRELVLRGGAAERVLDCAEDLRADLLVIGAQHKLFRDATVIGTTTDRLIRFASCPVLAVPRKLVHVQESDKEREGELAMT